jgi:glutamyl/glutaminyl-tRNA synthetase
MYRGRIAPSPTGYLHLGHARTFLCAQQRAREANGNLILRMEDLDPARCRREFDDAMVEDLQWFGLSWDEGPDRGGPFQPYRQSERLDLYRAALATLRAAGLVYPCYCSRKDVAAASLAPHDEHEEPIYPGTCRKFAGAASSLPENVNWRFRVPDGEEISFVDARLGLRRAVAGEHFGDFVIWRRDDVPAYQLAATVDDAAMQISEVVRGQDLLTSTFRQLLIYRALGHEAPAFYHTALLTDATGKRLAKRDESLSLRALRSAGAKPDELVQ